MARSKKEIEADILLAEDEHTPKEVLLNLWSTSHSVRVRKAIARNPNADPVVMRQAARLYLEEILENPGFLLFAMFDKDEWVEKIFTAFNAPHEFQAKYGSMYNYSYRNHDLQNHVYWATLMSPMLNDWLLERVLNGMSVTGFRRAVKNPGTLGKVKNIVLTELYRPDPNSWSFSLQSIVLLYNEEVLSLAEFVSCLKMFPASSSSSSKKTYKALMSELAKGCVEIKDPLTNNLYHEAFWRSILVARPNVVKWVEFRGPVHELLQLFTRAYKTIFQDPTQVNLPKKLLASHRKTLEKHIISCISQIYFVNTTSDSFNKLHDFLAQNDLKHVDIRGCGMIFLAKHYLEKLVHCPWNVRRFFLLKGCVTEWTNSFPDALTFKLFDETNNECFEHLGFEGLLYNSATIVGRVVKIKPERHKAV